MTGLAMPGWWRDRSVWRALALLYVFRLVAAWLTGRPIVDVVAASGVTHLPAGDAALAEPGAATLLLVLTEQRHLLEAGLSSAAQVFLLAAVGGVALEYLLLRALCGRTGADAADAPLRRAAHFAGLAVATWVARAAVLVLTVQVASSARAMFDSARDERVPDVALAAACAVGLVLQLLLGAVRDLAGLVIVSRGAPFVDAVAGAFAVLRQHAVPLLSTLAGSKLGAAAAMIASAAIVAALGGAGQPAPPSLAFVIHQVGVASALALHAAWLGAAVGRVAPHRGTPPPADAQSDAFL